MGLGAAGTMRSAPLSAMGGSTRSRSGGGYSTRSSSGGSEAGEPAYLCQLYSASRNWDTHTADVDTVFCLSQQINLA